MFEYNNRADSINNKEARATIQFLDERINKVISDLANAERSIEIYKKNNQMTDLTADVQFYVDQMKEIQTKIVEMEAQGHAIRFMEDFVQNPANKYNLVPVLMNVQEGEKGGSITTYNELLVNRQRMLQNSKEDNPLFTVMDKQLDQMRKSVALTIKNAQESLNLTLKDLKSKEKAILDKMGNVPTQEREFMNYKRDQEIAQGVYLILLQKREEALLKLNKSMNRALIVDEAFVKSTPVAPRKLYAALAVFLLTIVVPVVYLFCKEQLIELKREYDKTSWRDIMDTDIYICSKPLQYFNVRNIGYGNASSKKVLIILGHFRDAELFFHQVKTFDDTWNDILYFKDLFHLDLYLFFHPVNTLFVEVDASFVYGIFFKLSRFKRMYMFEEGFGSYRRDRFDNSKGLKNIINKLTGVGDHIGFSKFLTGQFLYLPDLYRSQFPGYSKSLKSFQKPFVKRLREELPLFLNFSTGYEEFLSVKNKSVGIYLTNHQINVNILKTLDKEKNDFDYVYVKLHPHIKKTEDLYQYGLKIVQSNIMVEFLILILLDNGNKLSVFHENSTSVIWFQDRIINKNMGQPFEEYDIVASYIQSKEL